MAQVVVHVSDEAHDTYCLYLVLPGYVSASVHPPVGIFKILRYTATYNICMYM